MFDHLLAVVPDAATTQWADEDGFLDLEDAPLPQVISAQARSAAHYIDLNANAHILTDLQCQQVHETFAAATSPNMTEADKRQTIVALQVPAAVQHLAVMLDAYNWEFVNQAKELRGYVVAKLLEETKHHDARVRLKAVELLGKLTEVASFTERTEIIKRDASPSELEDRIKARLDKFGIMLPKPQEVTTIEADGDIEEVALVRSPARPTRAGPPLHTPPPKE